MADYEVEVLVRGRPVKSFKHKGDRFIEGRHGSSFELKITNNTWNRIEVVTSVDGLSVVDGEECGSESEGYLVPAKESIVIPGWRLPGDKAAEFVFEDKRKSYSNQVGKGTQNVGVIGLMVFAEKVVYNTLNIPTPIPNPQPINPPWYPNPPWHQPYWSNITVGSTAGSPTRAFSQTVSDNTIYNMSQSSVDSESVTERRISLDETLVGSAHANLSANAASVGVEVTPSFEIGTGWGDEIDHKVHEVEFEREDKFNPVKLLSIFYDTRKGLESRGIQVIKTKKKKVSNLPNAFPTYKSSGCNPPPGWKGKK